MGVIQVGPTILCRFIAGAIVRLRLHKTILLHPSITMINPLDSDQKISNCPEGSGNQKDQRKKLQENIKRGENTQQIQNQRLNETI